MPKILLYFNNWFNDLFNICYFNLLNKFLSIYVSFIILLNYNN